MGMNISTNGSIQSTVENYVESLQKRLNKELKKHQKQINKELLNIIDKRIHSFAEKSAIMFYSSYTPVFYTRRGDLANIFQTQVTDDELKYWFDPDILTYRDGVSGGEWGLYDTVWRKGYHGGANLNGTGKYKVPHTYPYKKYDGEGHGASPWRDKSIQYGWDAAVKSPISPLEYFLQLKTDYEDNGYMKDKTAVYQKFLDKIL